MHACPCPFAAPPRALGCASQDPALRRPHPMPETRPGPTSRIYFSQRLRLHYVDWGNPDAPPLLLVHGGRDHCRNWDWVASALRRDGTSWHPIYAATATANGLRTAIIRSPAMSMIWLS